MERWRSSLSAHRLSNTFIIIGFMIAFLALFLGLSLYENNAQTEQEIDSYRYTYQTAYTVYGMEEVQGAFVQLCHNSDVNIDIFEYMVYINDAQATRPCEVRMNHVEDSIYPLLEGSWENEDITGDTVPTVVAGRAYEPYMITRDGDKYLTINYREYKVTGILSGTLDYAVILDYETMPEPEQEKIWQADSVSIRFGSEDTSVAETVELLLQRLTAREIHFELAEQTGSAAYNTLEEENVTFYLLIYAFALGICIISSELWIFERKNEIVIRKVFGWNKDQIIEHYYKEFLSVLSVGVIISVILQFVIALALKQYLEPSPYYVCIAICMVLISSVVAFIIPMIQIQCYMPEELLTKESECV